MYTVHPVMECVRVDVGDGSDVDLVVKFCYSRDMLSTDSGADAAMIARIRSGWNKLRQLAAFLPAKDTSMHVRGKVYSSYVRSYMLYGSKTWPCEKGK